jgi:hypothetical protein
MTAVNHGAAALRGRPFSRKGNAMRDLVERTGDVVLRDYQMESLRRILEFVIQTEGNHFWEDDPPRVYSDVQQLAEDLGEADLVGRILDLKERYCRNAG